MTDESTPEATKARVLQAATAHVPFDGWSDVTLRAAAGDSGVSPDLARALFPRGGIDLAVAFHQQGDQQMRDRLAALDLSALRFRDRIALAVRTRLELIEDPELVRRGSTLFALPQHAAEGARLIWSTADAIWTVLGDEARDVNWYTKRATLSAVYAAVVLYWLGDTSPGHQDSWAFLDRRIDDVMQIEKAKAKLRDNPLGKALLAGPGKVMERLRAPNLPEIGLPGRSRRF